MVIHRVWKGINPGTSNENLPSVITAEDSAKQKLLSSNSANVLSALKKRFDHKHHQDEGLRSLELLRFNIQTYFNKEVDIIIQKITQLFILPAIKNIKESSGEQISDEQLQKICCSLLENSKSQYSTAYMSSPVSSAANSPEMEVSDSSSCSSTTGNATSLLANALLKRKRTDSETESSKRQFFLTPYFQASSSSFQNVNMATSSANALQIVSTTLPPFKSSFAFGPGSSTKNTLTSALCAPKITTKEILWSVSSITMDTLFVLDSQFSSESSEDTKDRLSNKYPQLIRYAPDEEDKNWLIAQNLIVPQQSYSKLLLFVREEVLKIFEDLNEYKNVTPEDMQGFKVPNFMFNKMQQFFSTLNERGQLLLSVANQQQKNQIKIASCGKLTNTTKPPHQLLHIIQTQTAGHSDIRNYAGKSYSFCSVPQQQDQLKQIQPQSSPQQVQKFIRATSLSSSHATLSALLSNQIQNMGSLENVNHSKAPHVQQADHDG